MDPGVTPVPRLTLTARTLGGMTIAELSGELDVTSCPALRDQLLGFLRPSSSRLVIDLSAVTYCDASGLAVLVGIDRRARLLGGSLSIAGVPQQVADLLHSSGLHRHLDVFPASA
jgi:anti-anti-sigma factor